MGSHVLSGNDFLGLGMKQAVSNIKRNRSDMPTANVYQEQTLCLALVRAGSGMSLLSPHDDLGKRAHSCLLQRRKEGHRTFK